MIAGASLKPVGYFDRGSKRIPWRIAPYPTRDSDGTMAVSGEDPICTARACTTGLPPGGRRGVSHVHWCLGALPHGHQLIVQVQPWERKAHNCSGLKTDEQCTVSCGPGYEVYNGVNMPRVRTCRLRRQTVPLWNATALTNQLASDNDIDTRALLVHGARNLLCFLNVLEAE